MNNKQLPIEHSLRQGWDLFKKHASFFIVLFLIMIIFSAILGFLSDGLQGRHASLLLIHGIGAAVGVVIEVGIIKTMLRAVDGKTLSFQSFISARNIYVRYFLASLLYGLIVFAGLILFIVPGIVWALKFQLYSYAIVDSDAGPVEALKASSRYTDGAKWSLLGANVLFMLINFAGAFLFLIGMFISIPVTMLALAFLFRSLQQQTHTKADVQEAHA